MQDDHLVANFLDVGERVGDEEDGPAIRLELQKQVLRADARSCVQAAHRLVEDVQIASGKKAGGKPELLGHALGIGAHGLLESGGLQIERGEHRPHAFLFVSAPEKLQHHRHEFAPGEEIGGGEPLGQEREAGAGPRAAVLDAVDFDRPGIEVAEIEQALDQRGLAGAVQAGEAQALARGNIEIDPAQHSGAPKALVHSAESNQRLGHKAGSPSSRMRR